MTVSVVSHRLYVSTHISLDNRRAAGKHQRSTQCQGLPDSPRSNSTVDLFELPPEGQVRIAVQGPKKELPELYGSQHGQEEINNSVEAYPCQKLSN